MSLLWQVYRQGRVTCGTGETLEEAKTEPTTPRRMSLLLSHSFRLISTIAVSILAFHHSSSLISSPTRYAVARILLLWYKQTQAAKQSERRLTTTFSTRKEKLLELILEGSSPRHNTFQPYQSCELMDDPPPQ